MRKTTQTMLRLPAWFDRNRYTSIQWDRGSTLSAVTPVAVVIGDPNAAYIQKGSNFLHIALENWPKVGMI